LRIPRLETRGARKEFLPSNVEASLLPPSHVAGGDYAVAVYVLNKALGRANNLLQ
jgi:hypothetical protein